MIHEDLILTIEALEGAIRQYKGHPDKANNARRMAMIAMSMKRQLDAPFLTISQLSNENGSRRIVARDFTLKQRVLEIRESMNATPEESSMLCIRDEIRHDADPDEESIRIASEAGASAGEAHRRWQNGEKPTLPYFPIRLDAETLFGLAGQILAWFGFEPQRSASHPDAKLDAREIAIAEWIRVQAKADRDEASQIMNGHEMGEFAEGSPSYQDELRVIALEAKAEDYESLATRIEANEWRVVE